MIFVAEDDNRGDEADAMRVFEVVVVLARVSAGPNGVRGDGGNGNGKACIKVAKERRRRRAIPGAASEPSKRQRVKRAQKHWHA